MRSIGKFLLCSSSNQASVDYRRARGLLASFLAVICIIAICWINNQGGSGESTSLRQIDFQEFNKQLSHDWNANKRAKKSKSSSMLAIQKQRLNDQRRELAQRRLEMKKVAEERAMEQMERKIELEATDQLAKHNSMLSNAIVASAPQMQPQIVFQGQFQPGQDAKSPGEAAAEMAAWGSGSNQAWAKLLHQQRIQDEAGKQQPQLRASVRSSSSQTPQMLSRAKESLAQEGDEAKKTSESNEALKMKELELESKLAKEEAQNAELKEKLIDAKLESEKVHEEKVVKQAVVVKESKESSGGSFLSAHIVPETLKRAAKEVATAAIARSQKHATSEQHSPVTKEEVIEKSPLPPASTAEKKLASNGQTESNVASTAIKEASTSSPKVTAPKAVSLPSGAIPKDATQHELIQYLLSGTHAQKKEAAAMLYKHEEEHSFPVTKQVKKIAQKHKLIAQQTKQPKMIKGAKRCCDSACVVVSRVCPDTHAIDDEAVKKVVLSSPDLLVTPLQYAEGKGPTDAQLQDWLINGNQQEKDEAAAIFFAKSHGELPKVKQSAAAPSTDKHAGGQVEKQKAARKDTSSTERSHASALDAPAGFSRSAIQVGIFLLRHAALTSPQASRVSDEAMDIVGDLAAEGH
eukprot:403861-Hanusia_phi.AAC.14